MNVMIVHDGQFHAHDIFVAAIAKSAGWDVVRTRLKSEIKDLIEQGAYAYDVGHNVEVNDESKHRILDHHGWKGYNGDLLTMFPLTLVKGLDQTKLSLLESIAKIDCGEEAIDYVSSMFSLFNPSWHEDDSKAYESYMFDKAVELAMKLLDGKWDFDCIKAVKERSLVANDGKSLAKTEFLEAVQRYSGDGVLIMDKFFPWQEYVINWNDENIADYCIKAVVFPEKGSDNWRVQVVPMNNEGFKSHISLNTVVVNSSCYFVHPAKFIAGFYSFESAVDTARKAVLDTRNWN